MSDVNSSIEEVVAAYLNGSLSNEDKNEIEELKRTNIAFKKSFEEELKIASMVQDEPEDVIKIKDQMSNNFQLLKSRIQHRENHQSLESGNSKKDKKHTLFKASFVTGIAASVLIIFGLYFYPLQENASTEYTLMTNTGTEQGIIAQIIFIEGTAADDIEQLLNEQSATLIGGPTSNGVFRIKLNSENDIEFWKEHNRVRWANIEEN